MWRLIEGLDLTGTIRFGGIEVPAVSVLEDEHGLRALVYETISPYLIAMAKVDMVIRSHPQGWEYISATNGWDERNSVVFASPVGILEATQTIQAEIEQRKLDAWRGGFVNVHTHTEMSSLDGLTTVDELVDLCQRFNQPAVVMTDHGVCAGHPQLIRKANEADLIPICGIEAYFVPDRFVREGQYNYFHLLLWAMNDAGLRSLWGASTEAYRTGFYGKPRMDFDILAHTEGLMASTACLRGPFTRLLLDGKIDQANALLGRFMEIFPDRLYVELHANQLPEQKLLNEYLVDFASTHSLPLIAAVDSHYPCKSDQELHQLWLKANTFSSSKDKETGDDSGLFANAQDYHLMTRSEVRQALSYLPQRAVDEALDNTIEMAKRVNPYSIVKSETPIYSIKEGRKYAVRRLVDMCMANWTRKITRRPRTYDESVYVERFEYEMQILKAKDYCDYFCIVADYVRWAKENHILVGPGRGSGSASLIAFLCDITEVDPVEYDLPFARFITIDRSDPPDFDVDFPASKRSDIQQYLTSRWGEDYVVRVGTHGRIKNKEAIRSAYRVLKDEVPIDFADVDAICKIIDEEQADSAGLGYSWEHVMTSSEEVLAPYRDRYPRLFSVAEGIVGRLKSYGKHAAGLVISTGDPLTGRLPLRNGDDQMVAEFDFPSLEALGLLKFDILTLRTLDTLQVCLDLIRERRGISINVYDWIEEFNDPMVWDSFGEGATLGVFQFETKCCSGETYVNGRKLKDLYRLQLAGKAPKTSLNVALDDGTLRRTPIRRIVESGIKEVHRMRTNSGRFLDATLDHKIMTSNGWKSLGEVQVGDLVLVNPNVKTQFFRICVDCGSQLDSHSSKSTRCYRCSARYFKNPSKDHTRAAMSAAAQKRVQEGWTSWNYGLTVDTSELLRATGLKIGAALAGRDVWAEKYGVEEAARLRKERHKKGPESPLFGKLPRHNPNKGFREDLGHFVRSAWEADYARVLVYLGVEYQYEPRTFTLDNSGQLITYTPDFYILSENRFVEIKGYMRELDALKIRLFREQYPEYNFSLIERSEFAELAMKYKGLVQWECPRIPDECQWEIVEDISPQGSVMTYDVSMAKAPYNFLANGFVVHNSMSKMVRKFQPTEIRHLADINSLVRPGPQRSGMTDAYFRRREGSESVSYPHPSLETILAPTQGLPIYQEQIMNICKVLAGFDDVEANKVRSILGKKKVDQVVAKGREFVAGCVNNGVDENSAKHLWEQMAEFSRYSFSVCHAVPYSMLGFYCGWLRVHYPEEFFTAVLSTVEKDRVPEFVSETQRLGFEVKSVDVNLSGKDFTPEEMAVRYGFLGIKGIGEKAVDAIVAAQPFTSYEDFRERMKGTACNLGTIKVLAAVGALDSLYPNRRELEAMIEAEADGSMEVCVDRTDATEGLPCKFDWTSEPVEFTPRGKPKRRKDPPKRCTKACRHYRPRGFSVSLDPYTEEEIRNREMEYLGVWLSSTPFDLIPEKLWESDLATGEQIEQAPPGVYKTVGLLRSTRAKKDSMDQTYGFVTFLAKDINLDAVVFSQEWNRYHRAFKTDRMGLYLLRKTDRGLQVKEFEPL